MHTRAYRAHQEVEGKAEGGKMAVSNKQVALQMIERMPDDASLEEIMYQLYFSERVERGLEELEEGKTVSHEEVKRSLAKWLQSAGR